MQLPPVGWTNPAAATQQSTASQRSAPPSTDAQVSQQAITDVASAEKSGDRDANERYDGPTPDSRTSKTSANPDEQLQSTVQDATQLPADDGEIHQLDLEG